MFPLSVTVCLPSCLFASCWTLPPPPSPATVLLASLPYAGLQAGPPAAALLLAYQMSLAGLFAYALLDTASICTHIQVLSLLFGCIGDRAFLVACHVLPPLILNPGCSRFPCNSVTAHPAVVGLHICAPEL